MMSGRTKKEKVYDKISCGANLQKRPFGGGEDIFVGGVRLYTWRESKSECILCLNSSEPERDVKSGESARVLRVFGFVFGINGCEFKLNDSTRGLSPFL